MRLKTVRKTRYVKCEGAHDTTFCKLLKEYYEPHDKLFVDIRKGKGGSQIDLVQEAIRETKTLDVETEKFIIMDHDRDEDEMREAETLATANNLKVVRPGQCIEQLLIKVLEPTKRINGWSSRKLKDYFQENYIPERKRTNIAVYRRKFPKTLLDTYRDDFKKLDNIIILFEE